MRLKDSVIFITGSAERVGKAIALLLARKGARVVIQYHTKKQKALETAQEIHKSGPEPLMMQGDIARTDHWLRMKDEIVNKFGEIDVLVNNAAIYYKTPLFETTEEQWDHFMNVNLKSVFFGGKIVGEYMYQQGHGKIINIADVAGENIWPSYIPYCVSKAGVLAVTKGLAKALAPYVTVNAISPGTVLLGEDYDKEEERQLIDKTPLKRIGVPEDIAAAVAFLIEGSDFISGTNIKVDGGRSLA